MDDAAENILLGILWMIAVVGTLAPWVLAALVAFGVIEIGPLHVVVHNQQSCPGP